MEDSDWDIRLEGRAWVAGEAHPRIDLLKTRKIEMLDGRVMWDEGDRLTLLALLLENVGAERAVQLGDPEV